MRFPAVRVLIAAFVGSAPALVQAQFETSPSVVQPDNAFDRAVAHPKRDNAAHGILSGSDYAQQRQPIPDDEPRKACFRCAARTCGRASIATATCS